MKKSIVALMIVLLLLMCSVAHAEESVNKAAEQYAGHICLNTVKFLPDATPEQFEQACAELEAQGATLRTTHVMGDNLYATYKLNGAVYQVSYTVYGEDDLVYPECYSSVNGVKMDLDLYKAGDYELFTNELRIVVDYTSTVDFLTEMPEYEAVSDTVITQIERNNKTDEDWGSGYVITLEDGRYVLIDGGASGGAMQTEGDIHRLYNFLNENNVHPSGEIVIAGWMFSHGHQDHIDIFTDFGEWYGDKVNLEMVICTASNDDWFMTYYMQDFAKGYGENIPVYSPQAGQVFYLANARFEVLQTGHSLYPYASYREDAYMPYANDASLVIRMTAGGQTMLWTGDMENPASYLLCRSLGDYLKSDMVQISHHGCTGHTAIKEFYDYVQPEIVFWDCDQYSAEIFRKEEAALIYLLGDYRVIPDETHISDYGTYKMCYLPYGSGEVEYYYPHGIEAPSVLCMDCPTCIERYREYLKNHQ